MYQNIPTKVLTCECRLSYVHLSQPYANPGSNEPPKYSCTLLVPKSELACKADIDASINAAITDAVARKWNSVKPPMIPTPVHDGDGVRQDGTPFGDECKGCWVITANAREDSKPHVVGIDNIACELLPTDIYSGMYGRATITFFGYNSKGKKGVGCSLGNVCKTRDGEPLSGGKASAESDFGSIAQTAAPVAGAIDPITGMPIR